MTPLAEEAGVETAVPPVPPSSMPSSSEPPRSASPPADRHASVTAPIPASAMAERSGYRPSRRSAPLAVAAALLMVAAIGASLMLAALVSARHDVRRRLATVIVHELDKAPPPRAVQPAKPKTSPLTTPPPRLSLAVQGPQVPVAITPPAPDPVAVAIEAPPAKAAAPVAAIAAPPSLINGGDLSSKMISAVPPQYPLESRRRREQGTVRLLVVVGTDGRVAECSIAQSSGSDRLDRAALGAVRRWRWSPTMVDGVTVSVRGTVSIPFALTT